MQKIVVTRKDAETFDVAVKGSIPTTHTVVLKREYWDRLTGGKASAETVIEKSFEFLLEREANTSILSRFELPLISRYFPEFEQSIVKRL